MQTLVEHLHRWGVPAKQILLDPLMRPHADYMTGCLFQIHLLQDSAGTSVAAAAGNFVFCPRSIYGVDVAAAAKCLVANRTFK